MYMFAAAIPACLVFSFIFYALSSVSAGNASYTRSSTGSSKSSGSSIGATTTISSDDSDDDSDNSTSGNDTKSF